MRFCFDARGVARRCRVIVMLTAAVLGSSHVAHGAATDVIVVTGQPAPNGVGTISFFPALPVLNDAGQVAFRAFVQTAPGATDAALFRATPSFIQQIARLGDAAPGGNGTFDELYWNWPAFNNAGQIGFGARIAGASSGTTEYGSYITNPAGTSLTQIARTGQAAPVGSGTFISPSPPVINDAGQAVIQAALGPIDQNGVGDAAFYRWSGGALQHVLRYNEPSPDGNGVFNSPNFIPAVNHA